MLENAGVFRAGLFFVAGPLRTGSSLMARCIDDHPAAICLCESEINRALFGDYYVKLHAERMIAHGLTHQETIDFLNRKKQDDLASMMNWYSEVSTRLSALYRKPCVLALGDKHPYFYQSPGVVEYLASSHRLVFTVRDPRAILGSIESQSDVPSEKKEERWANLIENFEAWRPHLKAPNLLVVKYEDLVTRPEWTMNAVYSHLDLPYSPNFLKSFERPFPARFLWKTAIDWETGIRMEFDKSRISSWRTILTEDQLERVYAQPRIAEFMEFFGYEK